MELAKSKGKVAIPVQVPTNSSVLTTPPVVYVPQPPYRSSNQPVEAVKAPSKREGKKDELNVLHRRGI